MTPVSGGGDTGGSSDPVPALPFAGGGVLAGLGRARPSPTILSVKDDFDVSRLAGPGAGAPSPAG